MKATRILLAEADLGARILAEAFFDGEEDLLLCGTTCSGYDVLDMVRETRPQVLLLSLELAGLDGLAVLRRLQKNPPEAAITIIVVSSFCDQRLMEYAISLGARYFMIKPVSYRDLPHTIRALMVEELEARTEQILMSMLRLPDTDEQPKPGKGLPAAASAAVALAGASGEGMLLKEAYYHTITTHHTDYACVEKNIRYLVGRIHCASTELYQAMMGCLPLVRPDNDSFLRLLAKMLRQEK